MPSSGGVFLWPNRIFDHDFLELLAVLNSTVRVIAIRRFSGSWIISLVNCLSRPQRFFVAQFVESADPWPTAVFIVCGPVSRPENRNRPRPPCTGLQFVAAGPDVQRSLLVNDADAGFMRAGLVILS